MDAIECSQIVARLKVHLGQVSYNPDLHRIYKNIEHMVSDISKIEVTCRQRKNYSALEEPILKFKESVDRLEKLILIAKLID